MVVGFHTDGRYVAICPRLGTSRLVQGPLRHYVQDVKGQDLAFKPRLTGRVGPDRLVLESRSARTWY